jgi:hypothetical protein
LFDFFSLNPCSPIHVCPWWWFPFSAGGPLLVAAGLWVENSVVLMTWPGAETDSAAQRTSNHPQPGPLPVVAMVQLGDVQARSIAVLPVGGEDVLLVGTNSGSVLLWDLLPQQEERQQGSSSKPHTSWTLQRARSVQVGNTSVTLGELWLPGDQQDHGAADGGCTSSASSLAGQQCRIAFAGSAAVIRVHQGLLLCRQQQQQQQAAAGSALLAAAAAGAAGTEAAPFSHPPLAAADCIMISRLCGSEGCQAAAAFHSPDLPHSLTWVSARGRLCFGGVDPEHKLRWRSRGLRGTPLALAWHQPTNTLVVLLQCGARQGDWQQQQDAQQLLLLDASSLQVLMTVQLSSRHTYTTLALLDLPCTSEGAQQHQEPHHNHQRQHQQQQVGMQPPESVKAFILSSATAAGATNLDSSSSSSRPAGCKPFVVLGSYSMVDFLSKAPSVGCNDPYIREIGLLSFFELRTCPVPELAAPESEQQQQQQEVSGGPHSSHLCYELVLHGLLPLGMIPCSMCSVLPELLFPEQHVTAAGAAAAADGSADRPSGSRHSRRTAPAGQAGATLEETAAAEQGSSSRTAAGGGVHQPRSEAAAGTARPRPLLVVGSQLGVTLLDVVVDDARQAEQQVIQDRLTAAAQVRADLPLPVDCCMLSGVALS